MNSVSLAFRQLARRPLQAVINALIMGLGLGMVTLLLLGQSQFEERMSRDARGIDLVVGAPGSPMQIILSSIYHVDIPTGNIPLDVRNDLLRDPVVDEVIPLALGDNHEGFRIVGTEHSYTAHYGARLREGRIFEETMEAVLGAEVARRTGMRAGDRFLGHHGLGIGGGLHGDHPYNVVGLLEYTGTVLDRLILTPVQSVWDVHDHGGYDHDHEHEGGHAHGEGHDHGHAHDHGHDDTHGHDNGHDHDHDDHGLGHTDEHGRHDTHEHEGEHAHDEEHDHDHGHDDGHGHVDDHEHAEKGQITALLVKYASPIAAARVPREINENTPWQAAEPAFQTARLISMIEPALAGLRIFGALLILASLLGVFAVLYQNLRERRYDLAVMRAIGAGPGQVFRLTLLEGLLMIAVGLLTGLMLGHGATAALALWSHEGRAMGLTGLTWVPGQTWLVVGVLVAGCVTALIPSWSAAHTEAAATLRRGH